MTTKVIAVQQRTPCKQIAVRLHESRVSAFPVLDDDGRVVGVVSATDLLAKEALTVAGNPRLSRLPARPHPRERANVAVVAHVIAEQARHLEGVVAVRAGLAEPELQA